MPTDITPTIGRVVHFYATAGQFQNNHPLAAIVADVRTARQFQNDHPKIPTVSGQTGHRLNLAVVQHNGTMTAAIDIFLVQDTNEHSSFDLQNMVPFCTWMPYQKGQAAKTDELEKALARSEVTDRARASPAPDPAVGLDRTYTLPHGVNHGYANPVVSKESGDTPEAFKGTLNEAVAGLTGPHITADEVNAEIKHITWHVTPAGLTTICEITLRCGFTVRGEASVMRKENFKFEIGRELSYQDAWKKIWPLLAYRLAANLHETAGL